MTLSLLTDLESDAFLASALLQLDVLQLVVVPLLALFLHLATDLVLLFLQPVQSVAEVFDVFLHLQHDVFQCYHSTYLKNKRYMRR